MDSTLVQSLMSSSTFSGKVRVMVFVDGGYLESNIKKKWGDDVTVDYSLFRESLIQHLPNRYAFDPYVIRIYYYDAVEEGIILPPEQEAKHKLVNDTGYFELRLGRLKKDGAGKPRQKGVDTLIAIDMVTKAYENHFDIAVLLAGDDDFLDVVKAVKNAGKQVFGFYFNHVTSEKLKNSFDQKQSIDTNFATQIRTPQRPFKAGDAAGNK